MRSIDERVVEMQFDNRQFESGVSTSLGTIEKLKSALNFDNTSKGLDDIGKAASGLSGAFDGGAMSSAIETISNRFSTLGIIGMTVLQDLTRSALDFAGKFVTMIPNKIAHGGWNRAMNLETARFQIEGLGVAWKEVAGDIDYGVADTAYGLDAAATAASQLIQSGIEIGGVYEGDEKHISMMGKALLGISGVAGMTSRSYEEISALFTSVAGQGRVTGDTLSRMGMKGLNAAADLAKFFNGVNDGSYEASESVTAAVKKITNGTKVSEEQVREFVTKKMVDANMFYESMWTMYGEHAKDANNTLTGILSNINAAFSKIGADFATPFIQNAIKPLQEIRLKINEVRNELGHADKESYGVLKTWQTLAPLISNAAVDWIKGIDLSWLDTFFAGIQNIIFSIALILKPIHEAFKDIFPPATAEQMQSFADKFKNLTSNFIISKESAENLKRTFKGVFAVFDIVKEAIVAVINAILPAGNIFKDMGAGILETTGSFGDYLVNLRDTIKESGFFEDAINKIKNSIKGFSDIIHGNFGPAIDAIKSAFNSIKGFLGEKLNLDIFGDSGKDVEGKVNPIKKAFEIFANVVNFLFDKLSNAVPMILSLIDKLWQGLKSAFTGIKETLTGGDLGQAVKNTTFAVVLYNLKNVVFNIRKIFEGLKKGDIGASLKSVFDNLSSMGDQLSKSFNANYFLKLGAALLMLAFAVDKLSKIDGAALGQSTLAVSVLIGELVGSMEILTKFGGTAGLSKVGTTMVLMSASILILASAMKKLADIPFDGLVQGLVAVTAMIFELTLVALILGTLGGDIPKGASALVVMAIAINILASSIDKLADIPFDGLVQGLIAVSIMLGELTVVALILGNLGGRIKGGLVGLIAMAAAILILTKAVDKLGSLQPEQMAQGLKGVTVLLLELAALMVAAKFGKMNIRMGVGLIALAAALLILSKAVDAFGKMDAGAVKQGIIAVGALLGIISVFSILAGMAKHILSSAIALVIVGSALKIISGVIENIGSMNTGQVIQGLVAMGAILLEVGIFAIAIQKLAPTFILTAIALTIFGGAMMIFAGVVALLGGMSLGTLAKGIIAMAVGLTAIGAIAAILGVVSPLILLFGIALGVVGAAVGIAAAGLLLLAAAFTALGAALPLVVTFMVSLIPALIKSIGEGIVQLIAVIGNSAATIAAAVTQVAVAVLASLTEIIPAIVEFVLSVVQSVLESLNAHLPEILTLVVDFILNLLATISEKIPEFVQTGMELMINLINGLADGIRNNTSATIEAVDNLMNAIVEAIGQWLTHFLDKGSELIMNIADGMGIQADSPVTAIGEIVQSVIDSIGDFVDDILQAGKDFVQGFADGIAEGAKNVWDAAKNLAGNAISAVKQRLDSNSPSKETEKEGKNFDDGLTKGVEENSNKPIEAVNNVAKEMVDSGSDAVVEFANRYLDVPPAVEEATEAIEKNSETVEQSSEVIEQNSEKVESASKTIKSAGQAVTETTKEVSTSTDVMSYGADVVNEFHRAYGKTFETLDDTTALEASKAAVEKLALATYEASKKAEDSTASAKKSAKEAGSTLDEIKKSFAGLKDSLTKTISGQMDIFKKFDKKTDLSADELLKNMQSQVNGVSEWAANIEILAEKGIDQGLLKKLSEMGPQGSEYVNAFMQMTGDQLQQANQLFATSLALPGTAAVQVMASYAYAGNNAVDGFLSGFSEKSGDVEAKSKEIASVVGETFKREAESGVIKEAGGKVPETVGTSIEENSSKAEEGTTGFAKDVAETLETNLVDAMPAIAENMCKTLAQSLRDNSDVVREAAAEVGNSGNSGMKDSAEINSPSKVWMGFGNYMIQGLVNGLNKYGHLAAEASSRVANDSIGELANSLNMLSDIAIDSEFQPTITPVLDLSNVRAGSKDIDSIFSNQTLSASLNRSYPSWVLNGGNRNISDPRVIADIIGSKVDSAMREYSQRVSNAISESAQNGSNVSVILEGDSSKIFRVVKSENDRMIKSTGFNPLGGTAGM